MSRQFTVRGLVAALMTAGALSAAAPGSALASSPTTCSGTPTAPGLLAGDYWGNVTVDGVCFVNGGHATVHGSVTVSPGSALVAAFALNDIGGSGTSSLTVTRALRVMNGGAALIGCLASSFPCLDDPNQNSPTLASADSLGRILGRDALGIIVHETTISGNVFESGGGGGVSCAPSGVFTAFGQPPYSDYEDSTIGGNLTIKNLRTCWVGTARVHVGGNARYVNNQLADRDGIEILANDITGNLACRSNSMVWDSAEIPQNGALFPRTPEPNTVGGRRSGQCVYSSPTTENGPLGTTPF